MFFIIQCLLCTIFWRCSGTPCIVIKENGHLPGRTIGIQCRQDAGRLLQGSGAILANPPALRSNLSALREESSSPALNNKQTNKKNGLNSEFVYVCAETNSTRNSISKLNVKEKKCLGNVRRCSNRIFGFVVF